MAAARQPVRDISGSGWISLRGDGRSHSRPPPRTHRREDVPGARSRRCGNRHCCRSEYRGRRALMYALAIIRYRKPLEDVIVHQDAHRAYLRGLKESGILIASGPMNPRFGGLVLLGVEDDGLNALDAVR